MFPWSHVLCQSLSFYSAPIQTHKLPRHSLGFTILQPTLGWCHSHCSLEFCVGGTKWLSVLWPQPHQTQLAPPSKKQSLHILFITLFWLLLLLFSLSLLADFLPTKSKFEVKSYFGFWTLDKLDKLFFFLNQVGFVSLHFLVRMLWPF